jgi:bifunctional enzyme CysN/CysC
VLILPSRQTTRIRSVETYDGPLEEASAGDSVILTTEDEMDISRGDMIVRRNNVPTTADRVDAIVCWMNDEPLDPTATYLLQHTTRQVRARIEKVAYRIDVDTLHREEVPTLGLNDIGRLTIATGSPIYFDPYQINAATGSFILVDPASNVTVAGGMIRGATRGETEEARTERKTSPNVVWEGFNIPREERERRNGHKAAVLWFTGLSGSGKTTIAREVERRLHDQGCQTMLLDGDHVRHGLCGDLGFSPVDRRENIRRVGEVARLFFEQGGIVLCTFVSPYREDRQRVRELFPEGRFLEIFVDCDLEELKRRDPKGLYAKVEKGEISGLSGVDAPYEAPSQPDIEVRTDDRGVDGSVLRVLAHLGRRINEK